MRVVLFALVGGALSNSQNWAMYLDLTLLLALLPHISKVALSASEEADVVALAAPASRVQMVIFYLASGVWKINTSFLHPQYSCASIYMVSLVGHRLTSNASVLHALARLAPAATVAAELLLPVLQLATPRLGVAATLLFHFLIGITPPPHNIAIYGVTTVTRLFFWLPEATARTCAELTSGRARWLGAAMAAFAAATMALVRTADGHGNPGLVGGTLRLDWCLGYLCCACVLLARALALEARGVPPRPRRGEASWLAWPMGALALAYAFGLPVLGLQERGGCLMFSQLRLHGGSNHLWAFPTGLLQRWMSTGDPASALSGGVVRITAFRTAGVDWVGQGFAQHLPPATQRMLRAADVPSRYVPVPYYQPGPSGLPIVSRPPEFVPFTLSALGLRHLLARARAIGAPFSVVYARLETPPQGDERWRQTAGKERTVTLREDPRRSTQSCRVTRDGRWWERLASGRGRGCDARERRLIEAPLRHVGLTHMLMPMPNPIVAGWTEGMHCVSIS